MKKLLVVAFFSVAACNTDSPYSGYSRGKEGVHFKLHRIGEQVQHARYGDFVTADIQYSTLDDSVFFKGRRKLRLEKSGAKGSIEACFRMLSEGESATFIISSQEFFTKTLQTTLPAFLNTDEMMKVKLDIIDIQTPEEYNFEKLAFLTWVEDFGEYEKVLLNKFLHEEELEVKPSATGLYCIPLRKSEGKKVEKGDTVTVNYEGRFLNGKFFDSTVRRKQPFQFVFGTEWQVIRGLEEAIGMMREGEKSLFIVPSDLAFGTEGSSTGIIPPFTSLIFEVEILEIN